MAKKILTLDDLAQFCSEHNMNRFSAEESGYKLCVQVPSVYSKDEEKSDDSMLYGKVKLLHTGLNRNKSNVTKSAAEKLMPGIKYKPLLADFCELEDGTKDFTSHAMEVNEDGTINYIEHQIGCFTADEPYMEYDEEKDRYYVYAYVAIPREYTEAADIIERKNGTKISAELYINEMSYDAKEKELLLEDCEVMGATCLGTNPETGEEVQEGMEGARLDIHDFSVENNSVQFDQNEKLIELLERVETALTDFNIQAEASAKENSGKEEISVMTKFEELLAKYNKSVEDITFDYEGLSDEELEATFAEAFEEAEPNGEPDGEPEGEPEPDPEGGDPEDSTVTENESVKFTVTHGDVVKEFSLSLNDKIAAMYSLVNDCYGEADNDYYDVAVYDDDKVVEMYGWFSGKSYRQSYKVKKDTYSLVGDRVEIYAKYLTQDEINALENMKANYSVIEDKLGKYESEPQKMEILESPSYGYVAETKEFAALKEQKNHFDLTIDEVRSQADAILLQYAKSASFATHPEVANAESKKSLPGTSHKTSRYGNLFRK